MKQVEAWETFTLTGDTLSTRKTRSSDIFQTGDAEARDILKQFAKKKFSGNISKTARWLKTSPQNVGRWLGTATVPGGVLLRIRDDVPELFSVAEPKSPYEKPYSHLDKNNLRPVMPLTVFVRFMQGVRRKKALLDLLDNRWAVDDDALWTVEGM